MAGTNEPEVKDIERVEIAPAGGENVDDDTEETVPDSSQENEGDEGAAEETPEGDDTEEAPEKPEKLVVKPKPEPVAEPEVKPKVEASGDEIVRLEDESDREFALRLENKKLRTKLRGERAADIVGPQVQRSASKPELSDEEKGVLGKYKPEEIAGLKEVIPVLAKELGFVRKDELESGNYSERSQEQLDSFLERHPEYLPENDPDGTRWDAFKDEYQMYKPPSNPKDFTKIFERVHRNVFGIKPAGSKTTINAQQEKTKVASHAGTSSTTATPKAKPATAKAAGLRVDMLKGFDDEEVADLLGDDE